MNIAASSPLFSLTDFENIAKDISEYFDAWEIMAEGKHYLWDIKSRFIEIISSLSFKYISIHAPFSDVNIGSLNPEMIDLSLSMTKRTIKIMNELNLVYLTIHPGKISPLGSLVPEKVIEITKENLIQIKKYCDEYGIKILLENMPKKRINICQRLEDVLNMIDGTGIEICFDIGHANTTNQIELFLNYEQFRNIHIHDNFGIEDEHFVIGTGNINFKNILDKIDKMYNGYVVIESNSLAEAVKSRDNIMKLLCK